MGDEVAVADAFGLSTGSGLRTSLLGYFTLTGFGPQHWQVRHPFSRVWVKVDAAPCPLA